MCFIVTVFPFVQVRKFRMRIQLHEKREASNEASIRLKIEMQPLCAVAKKAEETEKNALNTQQTKYRLKSIRAISFFVRRFRIVTWLFVSNSNKKAALHGIQTTDSCWSHSYNVANTRKMQNAILFEWRRHIASKKVHFNFATDRNEDGKNNNTETKHRRMKHATRSRQIVGRECDRVADA